MNAKIYIISIVLFMTVVCRTSPGLGAWVTTVLDMPYVGSPDIAIDSSGNVHITHTGGISGHITYYTGDTNTQQRYVTNASGAWSGRSIENYAPLHGSVIIDSKDHVHIYGLEKNEDSYLELTHATIESEIWHVSSTIIDETPIISGPGFSAKYTDESIYLDNSDRLHITYLIKNNNYENVIKYATNASGSWTVTDIYTVGYSNISIPSIVVDSAQNVHIAFIEDYRLKYATNASGDFLFTDVIPNEYAGSPSIALDKYDRPGIAFIGVGQMLKFAAKVADVWTIENVEHFVNSATSLRCSLLFDSRSKAHISYEYITDVVDSGYIKMYAIKYASNADGSWQTSLIDYNPIKGFTNILFSMKRPSMAIDSLDNVYLVYSAGYGNQGITSSINYGLLKYATNLRPKFDSTGKWTYQTSGNWFTGAAGCEGDRPETGSISITQEGRSVVGILGGKTFNGYAGASEYEFYSKFPDGDGITKFLTYLSITSSTTAYGTMLWFWDGNRPCWGGSNIDLTKIDGKVVLINYPAPEKPALSKLPFVPILLLDN